MIKLNYRPEIDGLRAIAVLAVIFYHVEFYFNDLKLFSGGFIGVDIFFVISGYLITSLIIEKGNNFNIYTFYLRRIRRIVPLLFLVTLLTVPFAYYLLLPNNFNDYGKSLIFTPLFLTNFVFWIQEGYWEFSSKLKPLLHTSVRNQMPSPYFV
jgi:peptidoglycan/LPS O-acetylase OafA/YrhL